MNAQTNTPDRAALAVRQIQANDLKTAAVTIRKALDMAPSDMLLHNLAATLLLMTGDPAGADTEWHNVLSDMPDDGLAHYGLALCALAHGDRAHAGDELGLAEANGDRASIMLARRYIEVLEQATGGGAGIALPDEFAASTLALSGLAAEHAGDHKKAVADLGAAIAALPGDPYGEPPGLVMTFEAQHPLRFGSAPLPTGNRLAANRAIKDKPLHGTVLLSPGDIGSDVGYLVFKVDGNLETISNAAPYKVAWDTSRVPNGVHRIDLIACDRSGGEITHLQRQVRTANANAPAAASVDAEKAGRIRSALWRFLAPNPSRAMLAYTAALAATAAGDRKSAASYLQLTAAVDPDYRDARARIEVLMPAAAEAALWRGGSSDNVVALTFDDGPKPGVTEHLLAALVRDSVPATFFVIGRHAVEYPQLVKSLGQAGMEVENHTYNHPNLALMAPPLVERELLRTNSAIESATGRKPQFFRPPGGNMNGDVTRAAARWGLTPCMWTVDGEALENGSPKRLIDYVVSKATPGAIILLHNGRMTTVEALPKIVDGLRKRGFSFVTVEQLAARMGAASVRAANPAHPGRG